MNALNKYGHLTKEEREQAATELLDSARGRYLLGQALALASLQLHETEPSNADDMELLGITFFAPFFTLTLMKDELHEPAQ